jgi:hypothetical protein
MSALQSSAIGLLLLAFSSAGSTCRGQSGSSDIAKDPGTPADVTLPGIDTSPLTPREKKEWSGYVSELLAPCSDVPVSIAQCVQEKRSCSRCLPAARYVLRGVRDGLSREQVEKSYHGRFDADLIKDVAVGDSPAKGPVGAPITLIEFADFECPYCAVMAPRLEEAFVKHPGQIRFVYKFMPLAGHPHGEIAARAGIAAISQGKFWEMHDKLFANRDHLEPQDLDSYAKDLGLDLNKFQKDAAGQAATDRLAAERKQADSLEVKGTPTIYINGREYDPQSDLNDWLALELGADTRTPPPMTPPTTAVIKPGGSAASSVQAPSPAPKK